MSPIIDQQRRLVEVGRLRMGEKRAGRNGSTYPAKLDTWRLTSPDRTRLEATAAIYGGKVAAWEGQYQLTTEADALDIAVVPGQALSQYFETWGQRHPKGHKPNPIVCVLRCDGQTELLSDRPCVCAATGKDTCRPTTRLSVMLRRVPGIGMWRLDTRGQIAAGELIGGVEMLELLTASNRPVRARLRLDQRTSIDQVTLETHNFVVPVLDIDMTVDEALDTLAGRVQPELTPGQTVTPTETAAVTGPGFTPVGELPSAPVGTIAEQVAGAGKEARASRRNAAEPLRATGRRPRAASEVVEGTAVVSTAGEPDVDGGSPAGTPAGEPTGDLGEPERPAGDGDGDESGGTTTRADSAAASPAGASPVATARAQRVAIVCNEAGITDDDDRHKFIGVVTEGRCTSGKQLDDDDFNLVLQTAERVKAGELRFVAHGFDGAPRLEENVATADDEAWWDKAQWVSYLKAHGLTQAKAMRQAKAIADELGVRVPSDLGADCDGRIWARLRAWIDTHQAAA